MLGSAFQHHCLHLCHGIIHAIKDRAGDNGMTDIQLLQLGDGGDRLDVVIVETMAGVHLQAQAMAVFHGMDDLLQLLVAPFSQRGINTLSIDSA